MAPTENFFPKPMDIYMKIYNSVHGEQTESDSEEEMELGSYLSDTLSELYNEDMEFESDDNSMNEIPLTPSNSYEEVQSGSLENYFEENPQTPLNSNEGVQTESLDNYFEETPQTSHSNLVVDRSLVSRRLVLVCRQLFDLDTDEDEESD